MPDRETLIDELWKHITSALGGQPESILSAGAARAAAALAGAADPDTDLTAASLLGQYHWLRSIALGDREGQEEERAAALRFLASVHRADPERVPAEMRALLSQEERSGSDESSDPKSVSARARDLVESYQRTGRQLLLDEAVALFRQAAAATQPGHADQAQRLSDLGAALGLLSDRTGDMSALREAVRCGREAVAMTPPSQRQPYLSNLGVSLRGLYLRTKDPTVLEEAIRTARECAASTPPDHPGYALERNALRFLLERLPESKERDGAWWEREVVGAAREAVTRAPQADPQRARLLHELGGTLNSLHQRTGRTNALEEAVQYVREAVAITPARHPDRFTYLTNLGIALKDLGKLSRQLKWLEESIDVKREALAAASPAERRRALGDFGASLLELYKETHRIALLEEAAPIGREAVASAPPGHPDRRKHLNHLGFVLQYLHARTNDVGFAEEAVDTVREAVASTPRDADGRGAVLGFFVLNLRVLYERTGRTDVLEELVEAMSETLAATPDSSPKRADDLADLSALFQGLFERTGRLEALERAVRVGQEAVTATADGHPRCAGTLCHLGGTLVELYIRTGRMDLLQGAIAAERAAAEAAPPGDPKRIQYLHHLANALLRLFTRTSQADALNEATRILRDVVAEAQADDPQRALYLTALGGALRFRYEQTGEADLLREMIQAERDAMALTPPGHPQHPMILNNLAGAYQLLYERTSQLEVLEEAIGYSRQALALTPPGNLGRAGRLFNLSVILRRLHGHTEQMSALNEAVRLAREALTLIPEDDPRYIQALSSLAAALQESFKNADSVSAREAASFENPIADSITRLLESVSLGLTGPEVLLEAVDLSRRVVRLTPDDEPERAKYLLNLGAALFTQADQAAHTGQAADSRRRALRDEARRYFRDAGDSLAGNTLVRIEGYRRSARLSADPDQAREGLEAIEKAIGLMDILAPGSLTRTDREHQISRIADLPGEAAAAALAAGRPDRAVELLERLRGLLTADVLDLRGQELARLRQDQPDLAGRLGKLRGRLGALDRVPSMSARQFWATERLEPVGDAERHLAAERRAAHAAWQDLLEQIRALAGFESFLQAPSVDQLARQAPDGSVVYVTTSQYRCDAIILAGSPGEHVRAVPLPGLTYRDAYRHAGNLGISLQIIADSTIDPMRRITAQQEIRKTLKWLWESVAEPVLKRLGHVKTPADGQEWPRVWWCPVGVLAFLPLHAAGQADTGGQDTVLDRVVSSYTTTVRALGHARSRRPAPEGNSTLIVPAPDLPGAPLPAVSDEIRAITRLVPDARLLLAPTRAEVLAALPDHPIAHFACHGQANRADPTRSQLILTDHADAPLTVADISALDMSGTLSFLSACDTSITSPQLADESLHITSAFQIAGYQHVIGTLWSVDDRTTPGLVDSFYRDITRDGRVPPDPESSAVALHRAVRELRKRYPNTPTLWAAHVHVGP
jgi:tetratricopeptide (TPR) repeat protein